MQQFASPLSVDQLQRNNSYLVVNKANPFIRETCIFQGVNNGTLLFKSRLADAQEYMFEPSDVNIFLSTTTNIDTFVDREDVPAFINFLKTNPNVSFPYIINYLVANRKNILLKEVFDNPEISGFFGDADFDAVIDHNDQKILNRFTAFGLAIVYANDFAFDKILAKDIDVNKVYNDAGATLFMYAIELSRWNYVLKMINSGKVEYTKTDRRGNTILHKLAESLQSDNNSYKAIVPIFFTMEGLSIHSQNKDKRTPLMVAAIAHNTVMINLILETPSMNIPVDGILPMNLQDNRGNTVLIHALENGDLPPDLYEKLIPLTDLTLRQPDGTPIAFAALMAYFYGKRFGFPTDGNLVNELIMLPDTSVWLNENNQGNCMFLYLLGMAGDQTIHNILDRILTNPEFFINRVTDKTEQSILHLCVQKGVFVDVVLNHPHVNANAQDIIGLTPLHYATKRFIVDEKDAIKLVLSKLILSPKVEIDAVDRNGNSALIRAVKEKRIPTALFLLSGVYKNRKFTVANVNIQNNDGLLVDDFMNNPNPSIKYLYDNLRARINEIRPLQK